MGLESKSAEIGGSGLDTLNAPVIITRGLKPKYRGVPDVIAFFAFIPCVVALVMSAEGQMAELASLIFGGSTLFLFATSAIYHTPMWPMWVRLILRRIDHAAIFVLIAGSYAPICLMGLDPSIGVPVFYAVCALSFVGMIVVIVWENSPRVLRTIVYTVLGAMILPLMPMVYFRVGGLFVSLIILGGIIHAVGGVIYARRYPNPNPSVFGYHELFHLFVITATAIHLVAAWVLASGFRY